MQAHIPSRKNRKVPREYDKYLYKLRHLVENAFAPEALARDRNALRKAFGFFFGSGPNQVCDVVGRHLVTTLSRAIRAA